MAIKHAKQSGLPSDDGSSAHVRPSDWYADHTGSVDDWYNVKAYGAVGNGSTDDHAAIQSAIDAAGAAGGGVVYFPASTYKIGTVGLTYNYDDLSLVGAGRGATILTYSGSGSAITNATPASSRKHIRVADATIDVTGASSGAIALHIQNTQFSVFERLRLEAYGTTFGCLRLTSDGNYYSTYRDIYCQGNGIALYFTGTGGCNRNTFENINAQGASGQFMKFDATTYVHDSNTFIGCSCEGMSTNPVIDFGGAGTYGAMRNFFFGLTLEACTYGPIMRANSTYNVFVGYHSPTTPLPTTIAGTSNFLFFADGTLGSAGGRILGSLDMTQINLPVKAGVPADGDEYDPHSGDAILDTTNSRIYFRVGSTWKYAALT